ncbi:MAG: hypothetical protein R3E08_01800 [Thiotrichaceae bacterium]
MLLFHAPNPQACGIAELDAQQRVIDFEESQLSPKQTLLMLIYVIDAPSVSPNW